MNGLPETGLLGKRLAMLIAALSPFAVPAWAEDPPPTTAQSKPNFPLFVGTSDTVFEQLYVAASDVAERKTQTSLLVERLRGGAFFSPGLSLQGELTYAPMRASLRQSGKDHVFRDQGLYLQQLYLKAEDDNLMGYIGKFDPQISWMADNAPGVFGADFVSDYQVREMLGTGAARRSGDDQIGHHTLGMAIFQADNTPLGSAAFTSPHFGDNDTARAGRLHYGDGGVGNTRYPRSGLIRLDGDATWLGAPSLNYHMAYALLYRGSGQSANQQDFVAGLDHTLQLGDDLYLQSQVEAAHILDNGGSPASGQNGPSASQRADYISLGASLWWNGWNLSAVRTSRDQVQPVNGDVIGRNSYDQLLTTSLGYSWSWGLWASVGWKHEHGYDGLIGAPASTQTVGLQFGYHQDF